MVSMSNSMNWKWFVMVMWCLVFSPAWVPPAFSAVGDVNYITDMLNVPVRSGPSNSHRIVHRGLSSGTRLTILAIDEEAGFSQIRTDNGTEGWVRSQYLIQNTIARDRLAATEKRLRKLQADLDKERKTRSDVQSETNTANEKNRALTSQVKTLTQELDEVKRISAEAINQHARIVELTKQNERLHNEVTDLSETVRRQDENIQREWMLIGGSLVLLGLIAGVILKSRPRQQASSYAPRYK